MASQAESLEEELAAHALMKSLTEYVPEILEQYPDAIAQLKGELSLNLGADFTNSQKYEEAASAYAEALSNYVFIDEPDMCREALRRFMEVFAMSNHNVTDVALQLLLQSGIRYELLAGTQGALELKELSDLCSARIYEVANTSVNKLAILIQLAKCRLFASTCAGQPRIDVSSTPSLNSLLQQIAEVETELQHLKSSGRELKEIEAPEPESPGTVDDDLYQLSSPIPGEAQMGADLQAIRGTETAVLDMYLGADPKGALAVYVFTYTNNSFLTSRVVHPSYTTYFLSGTRRGQKVLFSAMAGFVRDARRGILAEPGFGPVTPEAQIEFKKWVEGFFSHALLEVLHESGRSHLCIIPNGPLHFFPFHLLGPIEMPFAQRWNITYNPHVSLVKRKQQAHNPTDMMLAGGKSFTTNNPRGLPEITEAVREAEEIAEMFASHALVEDAFTPSSLLSRIDSCRYVHVSTHGEQNVLAPSFHTLFMSPDDGGSDTVSAYQIHKLDLSDVDLLTLSACETGLGRVDAGDNLGGLPASFLIAGVRTVVATLWQVISSASRVFFLRLYAELKIGRSKLEAFATAQAATRDAFPAYRDWGAFYMIGNWT